MAEKVDLNCDMGESFGAWKMGDDENVLRHISSANVACGFHGGDPRIMGRTVELAKTYGVAVGAHPGFPDLVGFGRRNMDVTPEEARTDVLYQIGALAGFCRRFELPLQHVKPHGQLNNLAMHDRRLADAIVAGIADFSPDLLIVAYGGELARAAEARGMRVAYEAFADREYNPDGTLVSRRLPGAVITDPDRVVERAVRMVQDGAITAVDGSRLDFPIHTLCVHGDTPGAAGLVERLRRAFAEAQIQIVPMAEILS
ncbi:LamB/YcsF family protein [Sulfobacillus harzensis]|uniref:5-oxoprolinase subunit A n=1 Tax=Sulfobacillus harzensis TaxID=2729629 RepID=A0A7Y0L5R4_9FIRM|nr:5-oxoprolinase subunit PxpA [Sulfobacillus harzensis]NMP23787.1 LamB/YcsF family protein [Sulfobacillus harzensis]